MAIIIAKPANIHLTKERIKQDTFTIESSLHFINIAYACNGRIFYCKSRNMYPKVWTYIEQVTPYNALIYINDSDPHLQKKEIKYSPPMIVNGKAAIVAAGSFLRISEADKRERTQLGVFVEDKLAVAMKAMPDLPFSCEGKWMINNILPNSGAAMAMLGRKGEIAIYNESLAFIRYQKDGYWAYDSVIGEPQPKVEEKTGQLLLTNHV